MQLTNRFFLNYTTFILLCFNFSSSNAQSQLYAGLKAGLNKCDVINDGHTGYYKTGFNAGIFIRLRIAKKWTSQFEIIYSGKGCHYNYKDKTYPIADHYLIRLYYIDFPLLFQYHQKKISYELGVGLGYLREQREYEQGRSLHDVKNRFNKTEETCMVGMSYAFNNNFGIDLRYSNSVLPIRNVPSKQYNSLFTLTLTVQTDFKKKKNMEESPLSN